MREEPSEPHRCRNQFHYKQIEKTAKIVPMTKKTKKALQKNVVEVLMLSGEEVKCSKFDST